MAADGLDILADNLALCPVEAEMLEGVICSNILRLAEVITMSQLLSTLLKVVPTVAL